MGDFDHHWTLRTQRMAGLVKPQCGIGDSDECLLWAVIDGGQGLRRKDAAPHPRAAMSPYLPVSAMPRMKPN